MRSVDAIQRGLRVCRRAPGPARLAWAVIAAGLLGCGSQLVAFDEPAGASVTVGGTYLGKMPVTKTLSVGPAHEVKVSLSREVLEPLNLPAKPGNTQVAGMLVLPKSTAGAARFRLPADLLKTALVDEGTVYWSYRGPQGDYVLLFKGSRWGVKRSDPEVEKWTEPYRNNVVVPATVGGTIGAVLGIPLSVLLL